MPVVGYFTAEIGLWSELHTYSGGLGVLAGDHVKSAADAGIPLVGVTLLYHQGYARQHIDSEGIQTETFPEVDMNRHLTEQTLSLNSNSMANHCLFMFGWLRFLVNQGTWFPCTSWIPDIQKTQPNIKNSHQDCMEAMMVFEFDKNTYSVLEACSCLIIWKWNSVDFT